MFHNISIFLIFCGVYVRQSVAVAVPCDGGKLVENFVLRGLHIPIIRCIFVVGLGDELLS